MSALGAVPGYAFPAFDYAETELLAVTIPTTVVTGANPFVLPIVVAGRGNAVYLRGATSRYIANAAVSSRTIDFVIMDGDGTVVDQYRGLTAVTATQAVSQIWNDRISTAYTVTGPLDFSPISGIVMPPGFSAAWRIFGNIAGDIMTSLAAYGISIPAVGTPGRIVPVAPVLLT